MFELTINGTVYQFKFGMGFLREINKTVSKAVDGLEGVKKNMGLQYKIAGLIDGDVEDLVDILDKANMGFSPRATRQVIDAYIDDENTNLDALFEKVLDFLQKANATKKTTLAILEAVEKEKAKMKAAEAVKAGE